MADEPTLGEVMRQVQALVLQVQELVKELRSDYVRKDLYDAKYSSAMRRISDAEAATKAVAQENDDREKSRLAFQRQIIAGVLVGVLVALIAAGFSALIALGGAV